MDTAVLDRCYLHAEYPLFPPTKLLSTYHSPRRDVDCEKAERSEVTSQSRILSSPVPDEEAGLDHPGCYFEQKEALTTRRQTGTST